MAHEMGPKTRRGSWSFSGLILPIYTTIYARSTYTTVYTTVYTICSSRAGRTKQARLPIDAGPPADTFTPRSRPVKPNGGRQAQVTVRSCSDRRHAGNAGPAERRRRVDRRAVAAVDWTGRRAAVSRACRRIKAASQHRWMHRWMPASSRHSAMSQHRSMHPWMPASC